MNLKKLGLPVLCCGAAFLTSCGYEYVKHNDLEYENAKIWIKEKFGEGTEQGTIRKPSSVTSEWLIDGKVYSVAAGSIDDGTRYLKDHFTNFLNGYSYNSVADINNTRIEERVQPNGEFGFKTTEKMTSNAPENFYYTLDEKHFDNTLSYFFKGANKYSARYRAYTNKTLEITGTFYYSIYNEPNKGYDMIQIPYCTITFDSNGLFKQIKFDFKAEAECNYFWVSVQQAKYSGATYFKLFKDTKIEINFNY